MITTYNATMSRSTRVLWLLEEIGAPYELVPVEIARPDGSGGPDPANPHPLGQVPCIRDGDELIVESLAIWLHLSDRNPQAGLAPAAGHERRAEYMGWMGLATCVFEPLVDASIRSVPLSDRQRAARQFLDARFAAALERGPWLMGEHFSTIDLVFGSMMLVFREVLTPTASIEEWLGRLAARPALARARAREGR